MKSSSNHKKIYRLKNISIDEVAKSFQTLNVEGKLSDYEMESIPMVGINMPITDITYKGNDTNKHLSTLSDKFIYLIHLIRNRQIANGGNFAPFSFCGIGENIW